MQVIDSTLNIASNSTHEAPLRRIRGGAASVEHKRQQALEDGGALKAHLVDPTSHLIDQVLGDAGSYKVLLGALIFSTSVTPRGRPRE